MKEVLATFDPKIVNEHCQRIFGPDDDAPIISANDPLRIAKTYFVDHFSTGEDHTLLHHKGEW